MSVEAKTNVQKNKAPYGLLINAHIPVFLLFSVLLYTEGLEVVIDKFSYDYFKGWIIITSPSFLMFALLDITVWKRWHEYSKLFRAWIILSALWAVSVVLDVNSNEPFGAHIYDGELSQTLGIISLPVIGGAIFPVVGMVFKAMARFKPTESFVIQYTAHLVVFLNILTVAAAYFFASRYDLSLLQFSTFIGCTLSTLAVLFFLKNRKSSERHKIEAKQHDIVAKQKLLESEKERIS
jgi:hypothetical protein